MSGSADVDDDLRAVAEDVVDSRPTAGLPGQGGGLPGAGVALDDEADPDLLVTVAHPAGQPGDAEQVDVTLGAWTSAPGR